jgi:pimeloyl-ACP methyl ester carboxylesterase
MRRICGRQSWVDRSCRIFGRWRFARDPHRPVTPTPDGRSWAERAYRKLIYFNEVEKGGHFAAWEQPDLFAAEIRAAFRPLR